MSVGKNIRIARHTVGLTLEELADKIGTTKQHVYRWEHQLINPGSKYLPRLSRALGVSLNELYDEQPLSEVNGEYQQFQEALARPKVRRRLHSLLPFLPQLDDEGWAYVLRSVQRVYKDTDRKSRRARFIEREA